MLFSEYKAKVSNIGIDDYAALLNIGRKWKSIENVEAQSIKIAVLGSNSIQLIASVLRALLSRYDLYTDLYEGEYNGILMDVFDENSKLYGFAPDYVVILPDYRDIEDMCPPILADEDIIQESIDRAHDQYVRIYNTIHKRLPQAQILMANCVIPAFDPLGSLAANYSFSKRIFYRSINNRLAKDRPPYVFILDVEELAEYIGKQSFINESAYFLNKSGFDLQYIGFYCDLIARQFEAFSGKPRKCLILDLDNTLWGGVVGDLGYDGIQLDPNDAEGEAFLAFQRYIVELKNRGVIISVCSKNDAENAKEPFEKNENMILHMNDISSFMANWDDKATNIRRIAEELNIGIDSMVFFDDNPTERELVKEFLPEVKVIDVPEDPALYVRALDRAFSFEWTQVTKEDIGRIQTYANNRDRNALMESSVDYDDFLINLQMHIECKKPIDTEIERFTQLTNKSNQFNLRTRRYSEAEVLDLIEDENKELMAIKLEDRFSKYGIIGCVVLSFSEDSCFIENWVMSCRVLKKGVENYTINKIVELARNRGCKKVEGEYIPTKKNSMVKDLYTTLGFDQIEVENEIIRFVLPFDRIVNYKQECHFMED